MDKFTAIAAFIIALLGAPTTIYITRSFVRRGQNKTDFEKSWREELRGDIKTLKEDLEKAAIVQEHLERKVDELKQENTNLQLALGLAIQRVAQLNGISYLEAEHLIFEGKKYLSLSE